ncbi:MAG: GNAT family N-acetyltransferase [Lachnospiraceae bacterium]|nr:GNAT family N-acetyltransferase [Lachnospiraceae bacterium]
MEELDNEAINELEEMLDTYDKQHITYQLNGQVSIGIKKDGKLIAGLDGCMTAFKIFYVSTVFVEEAYRGLGYGTALMKEVEKRAVKLGANMIRLDTFDWQGKGFYERVGYEQVGFYENKEDGFSEYFFLKRL